MTNAERRLLLMVAKDMRRLWQENPEFFGAQLHHFPNTVSERREQYDHTIHTVEEADKREVTLDNHGLEES